MKVPLLLTLLTISSILTGQNCSMTGAKIKAKADKEINYTVSYGLCYHYSSTTVEVGYKSHFISATSMNPVMNRATPRMQDETYIGYTYRQTLNKKLNIGTSILVRVNEVKPVYRFFIDYKILGPIHIHGSSIQIHDGMNHLIAGIKLVL